jgi:glucose/arabinose dehydrogenase
VNVFAHSFREPRWLAIAPDGDVFVADSEAGEVVVLRDPQHTGGAQQREVFADELDRPFGIAFREDYVYVGNTSGVVRFRFDPKTSKRLGEAEPILDLPPGGHSTRSLAFSADGAKLFIGVGSRSNVSIEADQRRATILVCDPDGKNARIYASGLRNPVGLAIEPGTGQLWTSVNERDGLGDDLPPDYFTSVRDAGFYGWPYSYIGDNVDDRVTPQRMDLVARAIVPDVLVGAHTAALQFAFYTGKQFPESYRGGAFLALHGSWNRSTRSGYQVVFIPFKNGKPAGDPVGFLNGFVPDPGAASVYGRPVGVAVAPDGALLVSDDGAGIIYRISAK